jgi:predicted peptidase
MNHNALLWLFVLTLFATGSSSQARAQKIASHDADYYAARAKAHVYKSDTGEKMPYRLFVPDGYDPQKKYPLVISFHGAGSCGDDNRRHLVDYVAGWTDEEIQKQYPSFILMPQCPKEQRWVDTGWGKGSYAHNEVPISKSMTLAKQIVDKVLRENSIDPKRVYVMGCSMGGYAAWSFTMRYPDLVAAAVPICGAGDPSMAPTLKDTPIWAFHGDKDNIVPVRGSLDMVDAIKGVGGTHMKVTTYKGVRHNSYVRAWKTPELLEWLFEQKQGE